MKNPGVFMFRQVILVTLCSTLFACVSQKVRLEKGVEVVYTLYTKGQKKEFREFLKRGSSAHLTATEGLFKAAAFPEQVKVEVYVPEKRSKPYLYTDMTVYLVEGSRPIAEIKDNHHTLDFQKMASLVKPGQRLVFEMNFENPRKDTPSSLRVISPVRSFLVE